MIIPTFRNLDCEILLDFSGVYKILTGEGKMSNKGVLLVYWKPSTAVALSKMDMISYTLFRNNLKIRPIYGNTILDDVPHPF